SPTTPHTLACTTPALINTPAPTAIYTLSLHDALPICHDRAPGHGGSVLGHARGRSAVHARPHVRGQSPGRGGGHRRDRRTGGEEIGRAHVLTPVTDQSRMPSSA